MSGYFEIKALSSLLKITGISNMLVGGGGRGCSMFLGKVGGGGALTLPGFRLRYFRP